MPTQTYSSRKDQRKIKKEQKNKKHEEHRRKEFIRRAAIWVIALIFIAGGVAAIIPRNPGVPSQNGGNDFTGSLVNTVTEADHAKGNPAALVSIVEYSDFECPACKIYFPIMKAIAEEQPNNVRMIYRHFPLPRHKFALTAARAAEAAGYQNKFWEMHDLLFLHQEEWIKLFNVKMAESQMTRYAGELGLNIDQFKNDLKRREISQKIIRDTESAKRARLTGTPSFFINNRLVQNPQSLDAFRILIETELERQNSATSSAERE